MVPQNWLSASPQHSPSLLGHQSGSALMGELWALVCHLQGQLLKIRARGQAEDGGKSKTAPPPPPAGDSVESSMLPSAGDRAGVLGKFERGCQPQGESELAGRDAHRKLEEGVHWMENVGRAFWWREWLEQRLRDVSAWCVWRDGGGGGSSSASGQKEPRRGRRARWREVVGHSWAGTLS